MLLKSVCRGRELPPLCHSLGKHRKLSLKQLSTNGATHISQQTVNFYSNAITPLNEDTELMYFAAVSMCNV